MVHVFEFVFVTAVLLCMVFGGLGWFCRFLWFGVCWVLTVSRVAWFFIIGYLIICVVAGWWVVWELPIGGLFC